MTVIRGSRRKLATFCDLALVSMATAPSRKPYHIATRWMRPSLSMVAIDMLLRSFRKASISSCDILILSRWLTPPPIAGFAGTGAAGLVT